MNISVQVITAGAQARIKALQAQVTQLQGALAAAGRTESIGNGRQISALSKFGNQLQWTGRQLQYNFSLPIAIAGAAAMKFAMDNEKAFTRIAKVYGDGTQAAKVMENELAALKKAFVALSNHYGVHQAQVLNIAADWAAAGASGVALARSVEQTLRVMVLGEMDATKATEALIAIQAQYNLSSAQLVETIAKLNIVENQTGVSLQGLIDGFMRAAGTARSAGVDVDHLAAMMAALVPAAGTAAQAGNALKTIISRIQSVTPESRDILERMGFAIDGVAWKSSNGAQKIEMLAQRFAKLAPAQRDVVAATIASRYQINKFNTLMDSVNAYLVKNTNHTNYYGKALAAAGNRTWYLNQAETELRKVLESNPQKFKQTWVILQNAMADIIVPMIPLILMAAATIKNMVEAFRGLPPEVQKAITLGLLFLALFGPLIRYIGSTMTLIGELGWFFGGLARAVLGSITPLLAFAATIAKGPFVALASMTRGLVGLGIALGGANARVMAFALGFAIRFSMVRSAFAATLGAAVVFGRGMDRIFVTLLLGIQRMVAVWGPGLTAIWSAVMASINAVTIARGRILSGIWLAINTAFAPITGAAMASVRAVMLAWGNIFGATWLAISMSFGPLWRAGLVSMQAITIAWGGGFQAVWAAIMLSIQRITAVLSMGSIWMRTLGMLAAITMAWGAGFRALWTAILLSVQRITAVVGALSIQRIWFMTLGALSGITMAWGAGFRAAWAAILLSIQRLTAVLTVTLPLMWRALVTTMGSLGVAASAAWGRGFAAGMSAIGGLIPRLIAFFRAAGIAITVAFSGPWGWAIAAVVAALVIFRKQIAQAIRNIIDYFRHLPEGVAKSFRPLVNIFHSAVNAVMRGFNALPKGVRDALIAVVRIVAAAVRKVYELFSYLNPFAHHSPSLVENVTNGMAEVRRQFGSITDISGPIKQAYNDIKRFGQATAGLMAGNDAAKRAGDRANLAKFAPGAVDEYDAMIRNLKVLTPLLGLLGEAVKRQQSVVDGLKTSLDAANATLDKASKKLDDLQKIADNASASLDEAKQRLSDYANTPIQGMKAMSDQIFANEMAQKKLRLEMMKMEDSIGGIDELRDKMSKLSGEIEILSGEQADLRGGGAGSEILGQYDSEIEALRKQQDSINETASEYQKLSDELEKLQRQGEKMDLENSLAFDPLTRQIEAAANAMKEMPFDEIMAGVQQANADIAKYTTEVDKANAAVDAQKAVVDAATAARDALQAQYDAESAKLDVLKDKYSQVETAIQDINSALQDMTSAAEDSIRRQQDALDKAKDGAGGGGRSSGALDNFNGAAGGDFPDVGGAGLGREGGMGDQSAMIDQFTQDLAKETGKMFEQFDIFGPIKRKWAQFTGWWSSTVNPAFASAGRGVADIWSNTIGAVDWLAPFKGVEWTKAFGNVKDIVKDAMKTASEWGKNIWKLFADDIKKIWDTIKQKFKEAIDKIAPEFESFKKEIEPASEALKKIWSYAKIVAGILGGILLGALKLITSILSNTVGPAFDAIIAVIKGFIRIIKGIVQIIIGIFTGDIGKIKEGVLSVLNGLWTAVWGVLKGAVLVFFGIIKGLVEGVVDFFVWLLDVLVGHSIIPDMVNSIIDWFKTLWDKCVEFVKGLAKGVVDKWNELWQAVKDALTAVKQWIETKFAEFKLGLEIIWKALAKAVSDKWNELWKAVKDGLAAAKQWVETKVEQLKATLTSKWNALKDTIKAAWDWVWDQVKAKIEWAKGKIDSAVQAIKAVIDNVRTGWNVIVDAVKKKVDDLVDKFNNLKNRFSFSGMFDGIKNAFKSAINWLIEKWNNLSFPAVSVGGVQLTPSVGTPNIGYLAKGGMIARHAMAVVGEGRAGYPEYVIPTDPLHRHRAMALFSKLGSELGAVPSKAGHAESRALRARTTRTVVQHTEKHETHLHFHGNLEFPNVKTADDADRFISHLESLAGGDN